MVAHMETQPPDVMQLRQQNMPAEWNEIKGIMKYRFHIGY
jgi:hypothetical protein